MTIFPCLPCIIQPVVPVQLTVTFSLGFNPNYLITLSGNIPYYFMPQFPLLTFLLPHPLGVSHCCFCPLAIFPCFPSLSCPKVTTLFSIHSHVTPFIQLR